MRKQSRRWAVSRNKRNLAKMTENSVTADEAEAALNALMPQLGLCLSEVQEYNPFSDKFKILAWKDDGSTELVKSAGKLVEVEIPGETIAKLVKTVRSLRRVAELRRKSEPVSA